MADYKYKAFISYSHRDKEVGAWLHEALERFRTPRAYIGKPTRNGPRPARLTRIFRDDAEVAAAEELGPVIESALQNSETLIVVCTPNAAQSEWVEKEIRRFKELRKGGGCVRHHRGRKAARQRSADRVLSQRAEMESERGRRAHPHSGGTARPRHTGTGTRNSVDQAGCGFARPRIRRPRPARRKTARTRAQARDHPGFNRRKPDRACSRRTGRRRISAHSERECALEPARRVFRTERRGPARAFGLARGPRRCPPRTEPCWARPQKQRSRLH